MFLFSGFCADMLTKLQENLINIMKIDMNDVDLMPIIGNVSKLQR